MPRFTVKEVRTLVARALRRAGASPATARATAAALIAAEVEGLGGHGVTRTALYAGHLRGGRVDGKARARVIKRRAAACLVDAAGGLAYPAAAIAVKEVIRRAQRYGVAFCGITNSHHFGAAAYHLVPFADAGMVGFAFTNSPAAVNAWGGKKPIYGTNPIAAIFPRRDGAPLVIDLSITEVARGRILVAAKEGKPIPSGWAFDPDGKPTTDARAALTGSMAAIGGVKGTMLALIVELLCCALTGAAFSFENDSFFEPGAKARIGHALLAIDPNALAGGEDYYARLEALLAAMLADEAVRLPGSRRHEAAARAHAEGIELAESVAAELARLAG